MTRNPSPYDRGYIYIARAGKYYKIGLSIKPWDRIRSGGYNINSPDDLRGPLRMVVLFEVSRMRDVERGLHDLFAHKRAVGEWFTLNDRDVATLEHIANQHGGNLVDEP